MEATGHNSPWNSDAVQEQANERIEGRIRDGKAVHPRREDTVNEWYIL